MVFAEDWSSRTLAVPSRISNQATRVMRLRKMRAPAKAFQVGTEFCISRICGNPFLMVIRNMWVPVLWISKTSTCPLRLEILLYWVEHSLLEILEPSTPTRLEAHRCAELHISIARTCAGRRGNVDRSNRLAWIKTTWNERSGTGVRRHFGCYARDI